MSYDFQRASRLTKKPGDNTTVIREFSWERVVPGCSTN